MNDITLTFLGTGAAIAQPNRFQACTAVRHAKGLVLFDVGEGAQYNLRKYEVPIRKEFTIAISHPHPDHYQGIGGLLASLQLLGRKAPVNVLVPKGFADFIKLLLHSCFVRTEFEINYIEMEPGSVFKGDGYRIEAITALHFKNALSYAWIEDDRPGKWDKDLIEKYNIPNKLRAKLSKGQTIEIGGATITPDQMIGPPRPGRKIVYSGDTRYNPELGMFARNADVLVHEATYPSSLQNEANAREHSSSTDAAKIGRMANAKVVILTHIGTRFLNFKTELEVTNEIHKTIIAKDGYKYLIPLS